MRQLIMQHVVALCSTVDIQMNADCNLKFSTQDYKAAFNLFTERPAALIQITLSQMLVFFFFFVRRDQSAYHFLQEAQRGSDCEGAEFMHPRLQMSIGG